MKSSRRIASDARYLVASAALVACMAAFASLRSAGRHAEVYYTAPVAPAPVATVDDCTCTPPQQAVQAQISGSPAQTVPVETSASSSSDDCTCTSGSSGDSSDSDKDKSVGDEATLTNSTDSSATVTRDADVISTGSDVQITVSSPSSR